MDGRTHRFTDSSNLQHINEEFMSELLKHKEICSPNILTTKENISDIINHLSSKSGDFILECVTYNNKSVKLNITSVYGDYGMYNFNKLIFYSKIK
jgi:hypothetical protein